MNSAATSSSPKIASPAALFTVVILSLENLLCMLLKKNGAVEEQLAKAINAPHPNAIFDESGYCITYATPHGIMIIDLRTNKVSRKLGTGEFGVRFLQIALYQGGRSKIVPDAAAEVNESKESLTDPMLFCCAWNKERLYLFSQREPEDPTEGRDAYPAIRRQINRKKLQISKS